MIIDLKSLDGKAFEKSLGEIESLVKKKGLKFQKVFLPTKKLTVDSEYELRIRRAILTITNPDATTVNGIKEALKPISQTVDVEAKRIKNALAQRGIRQEEEYIKGKLCTRIELKKEF